MGKRFRLWGPGAALLLSGLGVWGALLAGQFRRETSRTTGRIVHRDATGSHFKFLLRNRVYEGRREGLLEEGAEVTVYYNPNRPERNHATTEGRLPPLREDSGFPLPGVLGTLAFVIGVGFLLGARFSFPRPSDRR